VTFQGLARPGREQGGVTSENGRQKAFDERFVASAVTRLAPGHLDQPGLTAAKVRDLESLAVVDDRAVGAPTTSTDTGESEDVMDARLGEV
jgi:hypothetical protein